MGLWGGKSVKDDSVMLGKEEDPESGREEQYGR
jgi:hypothetical protein